MSNEKQIYDKEIEDLHKNFNEYSSDIKVLTFQKDEIKKKIQDIILKNNIGDDEKVIFVDSKGNEIFKRGAGSEKESIDEKSLKTLPICTLDIDLIKKENQQLYDVLVKKGYVKEMTVYQYAKIKGACKFSKRAGILTSAGVENE